MSKPRTRYLVDLGFDEEELDEGGRALDGGVDVVERQRLLANHVVVLRQEVLDPQQRGRRLLFTVICKTPTLRQVTEQPLGRRCRPGEPPDPPHTHTHTHRWR